MKFVTLIAAAIAAITLISFCGNSHEKRKFENAARADSISIALQAKAITLRRQCEAKISILEGDARPQKRTKIVPISASEAVHYQRYDNPPE